MTKNQGFKRLLNIFTLMFVVLSFVYILWLLIRVSNFKTFWVDELTSIWFSESGISNVIKRMIVRSDPHPPGYQLLLAIVLDLGESKIQAIPRLLSVFSGLLTYLMGFLIIYRSYSKEFFQFFLLFTSFFWITKDQIYYSTEVRSYQISLFFLALLIYLDKFSNIQNKRIYLGVVSFLISFISYIGTILVFSIFIVSVIESRLKFRVHLYLLIGPILTSIYYLYTLFKNPSTRKLQGFDPIFHLKDLFVNNIYKDTSFNYLILSITFFGIIFLISKHKNLAFSKVLNISNKTGLFYFLVTFIVVEFISIFYPIYQPRNFHFLKFIIPLFLLEMMYIIFKNSKLIFYLFFGITLFLSQSLFFNISSEIMSDEMRKGENFYSSLINEDVPLLLVNDDLATKSKIQSEYSNREVNNIFYLENILYYDIKILEKDAVYKLNSSQLEKEYFEQIQILGSHGADKQINILEDYLIKNQYICKNKIEFGTNILKTCTR